MLQWRDEHEVKQAEYLRTVKTFASLSSVWSQMADAYTKSTSTLESSSFRGHVAYARQKAAMYQAYESEGRTILSRHDPKLLAVIDSLPSFVAYIREQRTPLEVTLAAAMGFVPSTSPTVADDPAAYEDEEDVDDILADLSLLDLRAFKEPGGDGDNNLDDSEGEGDDDGLENAEIGSVATPAVKPIEALSGKRKRKRGESDEESGDERTRR